MRRVLCRDQRWLVDMGDRDYSRSDRVGDQIQRNLAEIISLELSDPRVPAGHRFGCRGFP